MLALIEVARVSSPRVSRRHGATASPLAMAAVTETVPVSAPMVSVTGTGFTVPVKLAFVATAVKVYRFVPVGLIPTVKLTPLITRWKEKEPAPVRERDGFKGV